MVNVDPSAFARVGAPDTTPKTTLGMLAGVRMGQEAGLRNIAMQQAKVDLRQDLDQEDQDRIATKATQEYMQAWKDNNREAMDAAITKGLPVGQKTFGELLKYTEGIDKNKLTETIHYGTAAFAAKTPEGRQKIIEQGMQVAPNSAAGQYLAQAQGMPFDQQTLHLASMPKMGQALGVFEGAKKTPEQIQQELDIKQAGVGIELAKFPERAMQRAQKSKELEQQKEIWEDRKRQLPVGMQKSLETSIDTSDAAWGTAEQLTGILNSIEADPNLVGGGLATSVTDWAKRITGAGDRGSAFRMLLTRMKVEEGIKNLPPGVASDKDIELVMKGIPDANASREVLQSWLRGARKVSIISGTYNAAKADWLSDPEHRDFSGFRQVWEAGREGQVESAFSKHGLEWRVEKNPWTGEPLAKPTARATPASAGAAVGSVIEQGKEQVKRIRVKLSDY